MSLEKIEKLLKHNLSEGDEKIILGKSLQK